MIARLAILGTITVEALVLYAINAWLASGLEEGEHAVSAFSFVALAWIAFALPAALDQFELSERVRSVLLVLATFVAIILVLRIEFAGDVAIWNLGWLGDLLSDAGEALGNNPDVMMGGVFVIAVWLRTLYRADGDIDLETVPRSVVLPFLIITLVLVVATYSDAGGEVGRAAAWVYGIAILSMALSQLAMSGATIGTLRSGSVVGMLLGGTALIAILGILLSTLVWGPISGPVSEGTSWFASKVVVAIFTPLFWLLEKIFNLLLPDNISFPTAEELAMPPAEPTADSGRGESTAMNIGGFVLRFLTIAVVVGLIALVVVWYSRRRRLRAAAAPAGPQSSSSGSLTDDLRSLFRRRRQPVATEARTADEATKLYLDVLREAEGKGHHREPAVTPDEFRPDLTAAFHAPVTDDITRAFTEARYAGRPVSEARLRELRERWRSRSPD